MPVVSNLSFYQLLRRQVKGIHDIVFVDIAASWFLILKIHSPKHEL